AAHDHSHRDDLRRQLARPGQHAGVALRGRVRCDRDVVVAGGGRLGHSGSLPAMACRTCLRTRVGRCPWAHRQRYSEGARMNMAAGSNTPALEMIDVRKSFGKTEIIRGLTLSVAAGERHAVIGPNGAGKSTTFHLISGRIPVTSGTIRLNGTDITDMPPYRINRMGMSRSFQITNIFHNLTVFENLRC